MKANIMDLALFKKYLQDGTALNNSTINLYTESVGSFLKTNPDIDNLEDYNNFLIKKSIKKRMFYLHSCIRHFLDYLDIDKHIKEGIKSNLIRPQLKDAVTPRIFLDDKKRMEVISNLEKEKHQILALLQNFTGARIGDFLRLKRGRVFYEEQNNKPVVRLDLIAKRQKRINAYIFDEQMQQMFIFYNNNLPKNIIDNYYFLEKGTMKGREGTLDNEFRLTKMNYLWYWQDLKNALVKSGVNPIMFATHDFRRCFSREIWDKYKDIQVLQRALQHGGITSTIRYLQQSGLQNKDIIQTYQETNKLSIENK